MHNYIFIKSNIIAFVLPDLCICCHVKEIWVLLGAECMLNRLGTHSALMLSFMGCFKKKPLNISSFFLFSFVKFLYFCLLNKPS